MINNITNIPMDPYERPCLENSYEAISCKTIICRIIKQKFMGTISYHFSRVLPHSMINSTDDVAIFVADLVAGRKQDFEKTVEHWEEKFREKGVTGIKQIIPMNQVKTEYGQFEMKKKLAMSFDHFLVDGRICGHLSHLLGSSFFKRRNHPTPVHIERADLKREIDIALRKTCMTIHSFGDSHSVQIGTISMKSPKLADNVWATCTSLAAEYPGGWANVRAVHIKTSISPSIPIYMNLGKLHGRLFDCLKNKNCIFHFLVKFSQNLDHFVSIEKMQILQIAALN